MPNRLSSVLDPSRLLYRPTANHGDLRGSPGFHAAEYLLFRNGKVRSAAEMSKGELEYLAALAQVLTEDCVALESWWKGADKLSEGKSKILEEAEIETNGSYASEMKNAGNTGSRYESQKEAITEIFDGCIDIVDELVEAKLGTPAKTQNPLECESRHSGTSLIDAVDNLISVRNSYEGINSKGASLPALVSEKSKETDERVKASISSTINSVKALKAPMFKNLKENKEGFKIAIAACEELSEALGKAKDVLAAKVPINDAASYHMQRMMQGVQREAGVNICTVKDYFANYYYIGGANYMPMAVVEDCEFSPTGPDKDGEEGAQLLDLSRTLVLTREGYGFVLDHDASRGLSFVKGRLNDGTLIFTADCSEERDVVVLDSKCTLSVKSENEVTAKVKVKVKRNDLPTAQKGMIVNALSERERERIRESVRGQIIACFEEGQKQDIDVFHLGEHIYRKYGEEWRKNQNKLYIRNIKFDAQIELAVK